jgi:hypothetical protein
MPSSKSTTVARSVLFVKLVNTSDPDISGNGNSKAYALMSRVFIGEDQQNKGDEAEVQITPDPSKPVLYSVNLMQILVHYRKDIIELSILTSQIEQQTHIKVMNY